MQSPFENIFNIIGGITEGNEKPMKHGFYNAFALFILTVCCAALYVLFLILEPFFKPLFWALLVGSLLHPFKYKLSKKLKSWLEDLGKSNTSVIFGFIIIPVNVINYASDTIGHQFMKHYKLVLGLLSAIFVLPWMYNAIPRSFACLFWQFTSFIGFSTTLLINLSSSYITLTVAAAYFISVYLVWTPERATYFRKASLFLWMVITGFIAGLSGAFQVYMFVVLQAIGITGFVIELLDTHKTLRLIDPETSILNALRRVLSNESETKAVIDEITDKDSTSESQSLSEDTVTPKDPSPISETPEAKRYGDSESVQSSPRHAKLMFKTRTMSELPLSNTRSKTAFENKILASFKQRSLDENYIKNSFNSDVETALYFKLLFYACACMLIWKYIWLLPVMVLFLSISLLKWMLEFFGIWLFCENQYNCLISKLKCWWDDRQSALIPAHVRGIAKMLSVCNESIRRTFYDSVDTVSTAIVIVALILFVICSTIFIIIQIYSETIVAIQLGGSLLNSTIVQNSKLHAYLPEGWEDKLDSLIDNAYTYGREGISTTVKNMLREGDPDKISRVEQQMVELWDRVYQRWVSGHFPSSGPQVDHRAVQDSWENLLHNISNTPGVFDVSGIVAWVRANVDTLTAIASSVWAPLASNVSLLAGSVGALTSLLLCGGGAIINFLINLVVFFTTLFYLLASSNALYKPVEMITQLQPNFGPRLGIALSVAINQVFRASFKMALFYGLWTWLVHNLFGAQVVYLPSVLAAVLGAAPFLGPYLAGVPAALDVWLQGRPMAALLLPLVQAAPMFFLDAAVYAEIKDGGHPYLTGLAIAGGLFYLGPEGAILGPLLLCSLMVALHLSSALLRDTPSHERPAPLSRVRLGAYM